MLLMLQDKYYVGLPDYRIDNATAIPKNVLPLEGEDENQIVDEIIESMPIFGQILRFV